MPNTYALSDIAREQASLLEKEAGNYWADWQQRRYSRCTINVESLRSAELLDTEK